MSLADLTAHAFSVSARVRGDELWQSDRVRSGSVGPEGADFEVLETLPYEVHLQVLPRSRIANVDCSCAQFAEGTTCLHVWAAIRQASAKKVFAIEGARPFSVRRSDGGYSAAPANIAPPVNWREQVTQAQIPPKQEVHNYGRVEKSSALSFLIDLPMSKRERQIQLRFLVQEHMKNGSLGVLKSAELNLDSRRLFPSVEDRDLLQAALGRTEPKLGYYSFSRGVPGVGVPGEYAEALLDQISKAGKLYLQRRETYSNAKSNRLTPIPYRFDPEPYKLVLSLKKEDDHYILSGGFRSQDGQKQLELSPVSAGRFVFFEDFMCSTDVTRKVNWYELFQKNPSLLIPASEVDAFLELYLRDRFAPELDLPPEINFSEQPGLTPQVHLVFSNVPSSSLIKARLAFRYGSEQVFALEATPYVYDIQNKQRLLRNFDFEKQVKEAFKTLDPMEPEVFPAFGADADGFFADTSFGAAAGKALSYGWEVLANQRRVQSATTFDMNVSSGVDWFDVNAEFDFQGVKIGLPEFLAQLRDGERFIKLGDGTFGLLPDDWMRRFGPLAELGEVTPNGLRLNRIQALFLTADLQDNEKFRADQKFNSLRKIVDELNDLKAKEPPKSFKGKLRGYQKQGLSWLQIIAKNEIGGILADDMGLGKTVQVLALVGANQKGEDKAPHLIVAPKSLIFNWQQEAHKFTPGLRILNLTGPKRSTNADDFASYDVILTTYQTLRSDIEMLRRVRFDALILDEAHYAKNPRSQVALACRLIQAKRRFALTGTPVENSLSDLFSILAIVNPGLLSEKNAQGWLREKDPDSYSRLARALKPFILRRTKEFVLKELPAKSEQVLYCELSPSERQRYDEMRAFYWGQLTGKVAEQGLGKSKIDVLEALLRLRQASCHQGLLDDKVRDQLSSKFELVLEQLEAVIQDGHKALVFSQFTSLLYLFRPHLEQRGIVFEYLDGQTRDREERVERFQNDSSIKVFLLSLKAGGVGLNLTAADYVFILDPWWNPAAESQAIDRTHRIGQKNKVFAYKIIAKDTIEEKILALQESKKSLAKKLVADESSLLKNLSFEDLEALFN